jgi:YbbR domain-containing protein
MAWHPFRNLGLKLVALAIGTGLWFAVNGPRVDRVVTGVPVSYRNLPVALDLVNQTQGVDVHVRGVEGQLSILQPTDFQVTVDLSGRLAGVVELPLRPDQIVAPPGVEVVQVVPSAVVLVLERRDPIELTIPAVPITMRNRAPTIRQVDLDPETVAVTVRGSSAALSRLDKQTIIAEIDLANRGPGKHVLDVRVIVGGTLTTTIIRPTTVTVQIH